MPARKVGFTRRRFLKSTAAAMASVTIVPAHVLGGRGRVAPSEKIGAALIGCGGRGPGTYHDLHRKHKLDVVKLAVCDIDKRRLSQARQIAHKEGATDCEAYTDFRRVIERPDIDVVAIATPPHWHALISIAAMEAGKDVLCEKPMTRFIAEGRAVADAAKRYNRVYQIGTYGRFGKQRRKDAALTRKILTSGLLEKTDAVHIVRGGFKAKQWSGLVNVKPRSTPDHLEWDLYQGPSPMRPFHPHRHGGTHRGYWDYEGGGLGDMGQHHLDPVTWEFGLDDTAPVEVVAHAPPAHPEVTGVWGWVELKYANGFTLVLDSGEWGKRYDRLAPKRVDKTALDADALVKLGAMPDPEPLVGFGEAVRTRQQAGGNAEAAYRTVTIMHLANIAIRTGREIRFDPVAERIVGDDEANRLVDIPRRAPWHL
jgi:predicted dehydrogenase